MKLRKQFYYKAPKWIKYLGINLAEEMSATYTANYKTLLKEVKHLNIKNGKTSFVYGLEDLILLR